MIVSSGSWMVDYMATAHSCWCVDMGSTAQEHGKHDAFVQQHPNSEIMALQDSHVDREREVHLDAASSAHYAATNSRVLLCRALCRCIYSSTRYTHL